MKRTSKYVLTLMMLAAVLLLTGSNARADSLTLSLVSPVGGPGGSLLSVSGTINAPLGNVGAVFLNGDSISLPGLFTLDDSPFLLNAPLSMNPGESYTGVLFTVAINPLAPLGTYTGFFTVLGGDNAGALNLISNTAAFDVVVTPEPATMVLLSTGLGGLLFQLRRRHKGKG